MISGAHTELTPLQSGVVVILGHHRDKAFTIAESISCMEAL